MTGKNEGEEGEKEIEDERKKERVKVTHKVKGEKMKCED